MGETNTGDLRRHKQNTVGNVAQIDEGTQNIVKSGGNTHHHNNNNSNNHKNTKKKKAHRSELPEIASSLLVLSQINAKMDLDNYPHLLKTVNDSIINNKQDSSIVYDILTGPNGNNEALKWLHESLGIKYDDSPFELDLSELKDKRYEFGFGDINSAFDLLKNNGFVTKHDEYVKSGLSGNKITEKSYFLATKKGRQLLDMLGIPVAFTEKRDDVLKALSYFEDMGQNIVSPDDLRIKMNDHGMEISKNKISGVMNYLQKKGMVQTLNNGSKKRDETITLSDKGRTFYDIMGINYAAQTQETAYDWETLERNSIIQFAPVTYSNDALNSVNDLDLRFIPDDKHEGLWGAIHIMVNGTPICAAYVNEDGKLMPSPETMYVASLKSQNNEISKNHMSDKYEFFQYIAGLNETSEENISALFADNNPYGVIEEITNGDYRNISRLVSSDGKIEPMGDEFYRAVAELFNQKEFDVIRGQGTQYHISGVSIKPTKSVL